MTSSKMFHFCGYNSEYWWDSSRYCLNVGLEKFLFSLNKFLPWGLPARIWTKYLKNESINRHCKQYHSVKLFSTKTKKRKNVTHQLSKHASLYKPFIRISFTWTCKEQSLNGKKFISANLTSIISLRTVSQDTLAYITHHCPCTW